MLCGSRLLLDVSILHGPALDSYSRLRICDRQWSKQRMRMNRRSPRSRICAAFSVHEIAQIVEAAVQEGPPIQLPSQMLEMAPAEEMSPAKILQTLVLLPLIAFFAYRAYKKRIKNLTQTKKEEKEEEKEDDELAAYRRQRRLQQRKQVGPAGAVLGAAMSAIVAWGALKFTLKVDSVFAVQKISSEWQIARISTTIRTIVVGTLWLMTSIFGVISLGTFLAGIELLIKGPPEAREESGAESEAVLPPQISAAEAPATSEVVAATEVSSKEISVGD